MRIAMLPCAGLGSRMNHYTQSQPKPLLPINQIPLLSYSLFLLKEWKVTDCIINLHYLGHLIEDYLKDFPYFQIHFSRESQLLGTAGGIRTAMMCTPLQGQFLFMNPDTIFWPDHSPFDDLADFVKTNNSTVSDSLLYLSLKQADNTERGFSSTNRLSYTTFEPVQIGKGPYFYSGISVLHTDLVKNIESNQVAELRDSFQEAKTLFGRRFQGQRIDCGTIAEYESLKTLDLVPTEWKHRWNSFLDGWPTAKIDISL